MRRRATRIRRLVVERLESRDLLAADFGDAPTPYPAASHEELGPTLGALRDTEAVSQPTAAADGDGADDDGVTFGVVRAGQLGATVTVSVQNAPAGAKLDAWIDFNGDGNWGGPGEQILASRSVTAGDNALTFDVPASATAGTTFARFRLSTAGALGLGGAAVDGEVEDYAVTIAGPASGLAAFSPAVLLSNAPFNSSDNIDAATTVDLDGDGDLDAIAGGSSGGPLVWYENSGIGHFATRVLGTQSLSYTALTSGDLDGDGDVDLVATVADQVLWFENDGSQAFTSHVAAASMSSVAAVALGDADSDGDLDILVGAAVPRHTWLENNGDQVFTRRDVAPILSNTFSISPVDMDGDGDLDILAALGSSFGTWYENTGAWTHVARTFGSAIYSSALAADLDGDGDQDVVTSRGISGGSAIEWHENDGNQTFSVRTVGSGTTSSARVTGIADVDGDGDLDVLSTVGGAVAWHKNDGAENFTTQTLSPAEVALNVLAGDFDGDGALDLLSISDVSASTANRIALRSQLVASDYGDAPAPYPTTIAESGARHQAVGPQLGTSRDVDADGVHSALADGEADDDGVTFGALQVGALGASVTVRVENAPAGAKLDAWVDFNGDGSWSGAGEQILGSAAVVQGENIFEFDVPASAEAGISFARFRLSTSGGLAPAGPAADGEVEDLPVTIAVATAATARFAPSTAFGQAYGAWRIRAADLDGDGDIDIIHNWSNGVLWAVNNGDGTYSTHALASTPGVLLNSANPTIVDLDRDGDLDVLVASVGRLDWFENLGGQSFVLRTIANLGAYRVWMAQAGDMDGDGDFDLVVSLGSTSFGVVMENDGLQNFTTRYTFVVNTIRALEIADVDRDGDLDFVAVGTTNGTSGDLHWFRNDGPFVFSAFGVDVRGMPYSTGGRIALAVADLDGDGDLDIAAGGGAGAQNARLAWHQQNADHSFTTHTIDFEQSAESVVAADVDGDGDFDLLVGGTNRPLDLYDNLGGGMFSRRSLTTNAIYEAAVADFNGDGALDLVAMPYNNGFQTLYFENRLFVDPDYGDAPASYGVARALNGAVHGGGGPQLGLLRDSESDGQPSINADGDGGDEDGVDFGEVQVGAGGTVVVDVQNAAAGARVDAWIDFNQDGMFAGVEEQILISTLVADGPNTLAFVAPPTALAGATFARVRISTSGALGRGGIADDGEVEDLAVTIAPVAESSGEFGRVHGAAGAAQILRTVDVDGDGDLDVLAGGTSGPPAWHENLGDGAFLGHGLLGGGGTPLGLRAADMDRDGDVDFVVINTSGVAWYENNGTESFRYRLTTNMTQLRGVFELADIDGDGDFDIIASRSYSSTSQISVLLNNGQQGFSSFLLVTTPTQTPSGIRTADIDGDGDLDFAVAFDQSSQGSLAWYENDGLSFVPHSLNLPNEPLIPTDDVAAVDFDGDGDMDLVAISNPASTMTVHWYENDGAEAFTRRVIGSASAASGSGVPVAHDRLQVADMDGDGDLDVVTSDASGYRFFRRESLATFTRLDLAGVAANSVSPLAIGDLNGDGTLEIVGTSYSLSGWFWMEAWPQGDYDRNGVVDEADRTLYEETLGNTATPAGAGADGDHTGVIDTPDLAIWQEHEGEAATPLRYAADYNQDQRIDGGDFLIWQRLLGATFPAPGYSRYDVDFSGAVDAGDLAVLRGQFGQGIVRDTTWLASPAADPASEPAIAAAVVAASEPDAERTLAPVLASNVTLAPTLDGERINATTNVAVRRPSFRPVVPHVAARDAALAMLPALREVSLPGVGDERDETSEPASRDSAGLSSVFSRRGVGEGL
jgi:hypothetical protein